jgi:hypothetical protein
VIRAHLNASPVVSRPRKQPPRPVPILNERKRMTDKKEPPKNDNTSPAYDKAKSNFDKGKSPATTRNDLDKQRREEKVKPAKK